MKSIFIIAAFNALFFVVLLLQKKRKAAHDKLLIAWLTYLGLFIGLYAIGTDFLFGGSHLLPVGLVSLFMLHGPFLYFYVQALTSPKQKWRSKVFLHVLPFIGFVLYLYVSTFFPDYANRINIDHVDHGLRSPFIYVLFLIATAVSGPLYIFLTIRLFRKLDRERVNQFSYPEEVNLAWLRKLTYIFGAVWTTLMIIAVIHHVLHLFTMEFCLNGLFLSLSAFVILIGYFGLRQERIFVDSADKITVSQSQQPSGSAGLNLNAEQTERYASTILTYMTTERPYLNPKLTLTELSEAVDIPTHHLSKVINDHFDRNFFEFVNNYRVEEVKSKISNDRYTQFSLLGIAHDSGFNSKSAFNRVFKEMTGTTPSEYKKSL